MAVVEAQMVADGWIRSATVPIQGQSRFDLHYICYGPVQP